MPFHWLDRTKEILKDLENQSIIVPSDVASDFCSPSFCVPKQNNPSEPRLVVDFTKINEKIKRPFHPMQSVTEAWRGVPPGMKWFATLDLSASYWQIPVHEESQELLTFMAPTGTEAGRFRWTRLPMGLAISSDRFNRLVEEAMKKSRG